MISYDHCAISYENCTIKKMSRVGGIFRVGRVTPIQQTKKFLTEEVNNAPVLALGNECLNK